MSGYTSVELDDIQDYWSVRFPPDLVGYYREHRCFGAPDHENALDWLKSDPDRIHDRIEWPFRGYWKDVLRRDFWWPEWGERPARIVDQYNKLRAIFDDAPKLIPLTLGHLYLSEEPHESGNPLISAFMSDTIYVAPSLAADLAHHERGEPRWPDGAKAKPIRFWNLVVDKYNLPDVDLPHALPAGSTRKSPYRALVEQAARREPK